MMGNQDYHNDPVNSFASHVHTMAKDENKKRIHNEIERRFRFDFDEPWVTKEPGM